MTEGRDREEADRQRAAAYRAIESALPPLSPEAIARATRAVQARPIPYPFGSGQGDEIAFRAGLKPMFREMLAVSTLPEARERFARAGFLTEVAPRLYGDTKDGWDDTRADLAPSAARQALFIGRDRAALLEAVALDLEKSDEADLALGRLLGYPRCCVEAFVAGSRHRKAPDVHRQSLARTEGVPRARLNTLDLAVFHFVPWYPCSFRCAPSSAYADRLAQVIAARAPDFVASIDRALAMHRLLLSDDLQISIEGSAREGTVTLGTVVPTSQHRPPRAVIDPPEAHVLARIVAWLSEGRTLRVMPDGLSLDGRVLALPIPPLLVPFGEHASLEDRE